MSRLKNAFGPICLLICALIWGLAFTAQSVGMEYVGPYTFQATRCVLAVVVLIPVFKTADLINKKRGVYKKPTKEDNLLLLKGGIVCGIFLSIGTNFQQVAIQYTTVGKAGFLTSLYLIIVPILGLFMHKKVSLRVWLCVMLAAVGLYFLSLFGKESMVFEFGDILLLVCALGFAFQIIAVDKYAPHVDCIRLSALQFFVCGIVSWTLAFVFETVNINDIFAAGLSIAYAGIMSCGGAYTLQIIGQKHCEPTIATLLMSLESVFALLGGVVILHQIPTPIEALGCALVFIAVICAQLPDKKVAV